MHVIYYLECHIRFKIIMCIVTSCVHTLSSILQRKNSVDVVQEERLSRNIQRKAQINNEIN